MSEKKVAVYLPNSLYLKIEKRIVESGNEFRSVEDYIEYVLEEVLKDNQETAGECDQKDVEEIKRRLKSLGYVE